MRNVSSLEFIQSTYPQPMRPYDIGHVPYHDGTYWQILDSQAVRETTTGCLQFSQKNQDDLKLSRLQNFMGLNWLRPHGHPLTVFKMTDQLIGEFHEFIEVNPNPSAWIRSPKLKGEYPEAVSELGDVQWYMAAIATSAGVTITDALTSRLTREFKAFFVEKDEPSVNDVDELIREGYKPRLASPQPGDVAADILSASAMVSIGASAIMETVNDDFDVDYIASRKKLVEVGLGHGIGMIAFHANLIGSSYTDIVRKNIHKLLLRADMQNLEKKSDRSAAEL